VKGPLDWWHLPPNKSFQRAGTHKVLGRGRLSAMHVPAPRARVPPLNSIVMRQGDLCPPVHGAIVDGVARVGT
jgi:hypothetical protein